MKFEDEQMEDLVEQWHDGDSETPLVEWIAEQTGATVKEVEWELYGKYAKDGAFL
jgi:hypothetical protein